MSDKLINMSDEALFVKLADMLYNINDMPNDKAFQRMLKNTYDLIIKRDISDKTKELAFQVFAS